MMGRAPLMSVVLLSTLMATFGGCNTPTDPNTAEYWIYRLDDTRDQEAAARKLGEMKDVKAVEPLMKVLKESENEKLRAVAAQSLGAIGDPRAVPALMAAITVNPGAGSDEATKAKSRITERAVNALGDIKAKEAADIILEVHRKARDMSVKMAVVRAMGSIRDPKFLPVMHEFLNQDDNMAARKMAVEVLGDARDVTAIPGLILSLYVENGGTSVYPQAAFALCQIGEPAVAPMVDTLLGKNAAVQKLAEAKKFVEGAVAIKALEVIADLGAKDAEDGAIAAWKVQNEDTRPYVHRAVALALARIGTSKGVAFLSQQLDEPSGELRGFYTEALNELSERAALPALLAASKKGPVESGKVNAFVAVTRLGDARDISAATATAKTNPKFPAELVRLQAAKECGEKVECWVSKLKDKDAKVRDRAAYALGRAGDKSAAEPLVAAIADKDLEVRYAIMWALHRVGSKANVEQLKAVAGKERGLPTHRGTGELKKLIAVLDARQG